MKKWTEELVTPKMAEEWLNLNPSNRKLRSGVVEKYAAEMTAGAWTECTVPIAFYDDCEVADGQHRLFAIIESGIPQTFLIRRGLARKAGLNIDTGVPRTLVDNARISGLDSGLTNELLAVCRAIATGERGGRYATNSDRLKMVADHREAGAWAIENGPKGRNVRNAAILGAIGRAWYAEKDDTLLHRYAVVLGNGFAEGKSESAAVSMRNYMLSKTGMGLTTQLWRDTFLKTQNSIAYFMRGASLTVIKSVSDEVYPLGRTMKNTSRFRDNEKFLAKKAARQRASA